MRVLLFSHDKTLFKNGSESQLRMAERGKICDALFILVPTVPGFAEMQLAPNVRAIPTNSGNKLSAFFKLQKLGRRITASERIQLISSQDPFEFGWIAKKIAERSGIPWIAELHGDFYSTNYWKWSGPANFFRHYLGKYVLRRAPFIRAVSSRIRTSLVLGLQIPDERIHTFPVETGVRPYLDMPRGSFLKDQYGNFECFILSVGSLNPVKNVGLQIRALYDVALRYPKTALVIVGDGPERKMLELLVDKLRLAPNVIFEGAVRDLQPYYSSADMFLMTSHAEGWGRVAVEAMAAGLPVVMTDVGLAGEFLRHGQNGLIVPRKNEKALTRAILRLEQDPNLKNRLGTAAREAARTLPTHEEFLEMYKNSWRECLEAHPSRSSDPA